MLRAPGEGVQGPLVLLSPREHSQFGRRAARHLPTPDGPERAFAQRTRDQWPWFWGPSPLRIVAASTQSGSMERIQVVLGDGQALFREGTRALLEADGDVEVVGQAGDGRAAVEFVEARRPNLLITEIDLPELDGIAVTRRVKECHPTVGVLILTVHEDEPSVFAALEADVDGYLLKDIEAGRLRQAVRDVHAGETVLHPTIAGQVLQRFRSNRDATQPTADQLTAPERAVLLLASRGLTNREIAQELHVSTRTVQQRLSVAFERLNARSRTEAAIRALQEGIFTLADL
jgi:DNA-binding NarL/FixJ family response regulator